jgi:hypothetical protein
VLVIKRFCRGILLVALIGLPFAISPKTTSCNVQAFGERMTCCNFCDQNYENCINGGGDPVAC